MSYSSRNMESIGITIKLDSGSQFELSSPTIDTVLKDVYTLAQEGYSCALPGSRLKYTIPAFGSSHVLVETMGTNDDVIVYGVRCNKDQRLLPEQVSKMVLDTFGVNISEKLTAISSPDSYETSQGDTVYPCGTLFTCGDYSNSSTWSAPHPHTSPPSQRPRHLPLSMIEEQLATPRPVATPSMTTPNHALVAGNGSFNVPGDTCVAATEDSAPDAGFRHAIVPMTTDIHEVLQPVHKIQHENHGSINVGDINLETPDRKYAVECLVQAKIQLTVTNGDALEQTPVPVDASREELEPRLSSQPEKASLLVAAALNKPNNQLVVGIGHQRKLSGVTLPPPPHSLQRQLSLPGKTINNEDCLFGCSQSETAGSDQNGSPLSPNTKPLAIQLEQSIGSPGYNEFVMPKPISMVLCENEVQAKVSHVAVLNESPVLMKVSADTTPSECVSMDTSLGDTADKPEINHCDDACVPMDARSEFDILAVNTATPPEEEPTENQRACPIESSDTPSDTKEISGLSEQVHILEHAMNGHCLKDTCNVDRNVEFPQAMEQMVHLIEDARNAGPVDEDLKGYIRKHCSQCRDAQCKVPHIIAGCPLAGAVSNGSGEYTDYHYTPNSPQQERCDVSCDQEAANLSTTSEADRFKQQQQHFPMQPSDHTDNSPVQPSLNQTAPFSPVLHRKGWLQQVPGGSRLASPTTEQRRPGHMSPMLSGGFQLPGFPTPPKGQYYQESQLEGQSYVYRQVSDQNGDMKKKSYLHMPSRNGGEFRKMFATPERKPKVASKGEFPSYGSFPKRPGMIVYSAKESELVPGQRYPCPHNVPDRDKLGKGGNGTVVKFPLGGTEYALKLTNYRDGELNIWSMLDHPNILPLLGVMLGDTSQLCYQFMPKLTGDLRSMMIDRGDLRTLLKNDPAQWTVVMGNTAYIIEEVLKGLMYLHEENVQHSDIKAHNILIGKKCSCVDLLHCDCSTTDKYSVVLADFDSMKKTKYSRKATQFSDICPNIMNDVDICHVKGTPAYRAPEQFKYCGSQPEYKKILTDGKVSHDLEGPWCDVWSLGVIIMQMVLGSHNKGTWITEASILTNRKEVKMAARIEGPVAIIRLRELLDLAHTHSELIPFAKVASACLKIDFRERPSASQVLEILQEQVKNKQK